MMENWFDFLLSVSFSVSPCCTSWQFMISSNKRSAVNTQADCLLMPWVLVRQWISWLWFWMAYQMEPINKLRHWSLHRKRSSRSGEPKYTVFWYQNSGIDFIFLQEETANPALWPKNARMFWTLWSKRKAPKLQILPGENQRSASSVWSILGDIRIQSHCWLES